MNMLTVSLSLLNVKDMKIAAEEAADRDTKLPVLEDVLKLFIELEENGGAKLGTQALIKVYDKE